MNGIERKHDMEIKEVKEMKAKLEKSIRDQIIEFYEKTGTKVSDVGLTRNEAIELGTNRVIETVYDVRVVVEL
jgi:hypothetical protein